MTLMESAMDARQVVRLWLANALALVGEHEEELGRLDAAAGDGDHGSTMVRGLRAANAAVAEADGSAGELLVQAGAAFSDAAGGASGALVGMWITIIGQRLGDGPYDLPALLEALQAGTNRVARLGKAQPGDKTLLDALTPFLAALQAQAAAGASLADGWRAALPAAEQGAAATRDMVARRGRSAKLGERSLGHADPGAVSMCYLLRAAADAFNQAGNE